jgi:DNA-binding NarL/FixJ family response regulator
MPNAAARRAKNAPEVRILLADDHPVVRQGLRTLLAARPGWKVCGEAGSGRQAVEQAEKVHPHVVIMDLAMPDGDGMEATREILGKFPETEVVLLTVHEKPHLIRELIEAGARGCVSKSDADRELVAAVEAVLERRAYFAPKMMKVVFDGVRAGAAGIETASPALLTPRQREIVRLLAEGRSNKEIAAMLGLGVKTIETHRTNIMRRLQLPTFSHLIRFAIRAGIVEA